MLNQLLLIHLYRPFLKYNKTNTPLPAHVSPRKICTQAASVISKLLRIYKRTYGLKQICNVVVYIAHTACTIHLLNLPEKNAQRDIIHGLRNLEEMAECWLCARRTLRILDTSASKWQVQLPVEASAVFERTHTKWGSWGLWDPATSPTSISDESPAASFNNLSPSINSPGRFSPSGAKPPAVQRTETTTANSAAGVPLGSQHPTGTTIAASVPPMRIARRVFGAQAQRPEFPPPEPTYLRPLSQLDYQVPTGFAVSGPSAPPGPSAVAGGWYDASGTHIETQGTSASNLSSVAEFGGPESLVRESQDWWTRNAAAMDIGVENWSPWTPGIPSPHLQYNNGHANLMNLAPQPSSSNGLESSAQASVGLHNAGLPPENAENDASKYEGHWP